MSEVKWKLSETADGATLAVLVGSDIKLVSDRDTNFQEILDLVRNGYVPAPELFDVERLVASRFDALSERVSVSNGRIYLDGDEIDSSLTRHIQRLLQDGVEDWKHFVLFLEKLEQNPEEHSRQQLFDWLNASDVTITEDGDFIAYKGVQSNGEDEGVYLSIHSGTAIVDGLLYEDQSIPNYVGAVVEMPRSEVQHDPSNACSVGLHAGTHDYASSYGSVLLTVKVNPRDVVSVPSDARGAKLRVCRYTVLEVNESRYTTPVYTYNESDYNDYPEDDWSDDEDDIVFQAEGATVYSSGDATFETDTPSVNPYMVKDDQGRLVNSQAKLDWDKVDKIRDDWDVLGYTIDELAKNYGVSNRTIQRIVYRESWVR